MVSETTLWALLHAMCGMHGGQKVAAKRLGISPQYLGDLLHGRRNMNARIAKALGYKRMVMYEQIGKH